MCVILEEKVYHFDVSTAAIRIYRLKHEPIGEASVPCMINKLDYETRKGLNGTPKHLLKANGFIEKN